MMVEYLAWDGTSNIDDIEVPAKQTQDNWQSIASEPENAVIAEGHAGEGIDVPFHTVGDNYTVSIDTDDGTITVS